MTDKWIPGTVYLRHADKHEKGWDTEHYCWNTERFIASQAAAADAEGGYVLVLTKADYDKQRATARKRP